MLPVVGYRLLGSIRPRPSNPENVSRGEANRFRFYDLGFRVGNFGLLSPEALDLRPWQKT